MSRMILPAIVCHLFLLITPAMPAPILYGAFLDGLSESPPNGSTGTGQAVIEIDSVAHTFRLVVGFNDLIGSTTAAHIHVINGPGDTDTMDTLGPVATQTPVFIDFPLGVTSGTYDHTFDSDDTSSYRSGWVTDSGGTAALAEQEFFSGIMEGRAYLNIHTSIVPGGEIRGFFTPVPEASSVMLSAIGAGALIASVCRRRAKWRSS